jgi:hypothetical protein
MENKISIYNEKVVSLTPIQFLNSVFSHKSICEMDSYEMKKQIILSLVATKEQMRVTSEISDIDKKEIQELILSRYKRLSVNEIYYAFKLERFSEYGDQISHYNRFDVIYFGQIMERYKEWKRKTKSEHNISFIEKPKELSDGQKQYWINKGVSDCVEYFEEHRQIEDGKTYVYQIIYDDGHLPTDVDYKKRVHKDALEALDFEYRNKKPTSLADKRKIKELLENLYEKNNGKVIAKCHEIALAEFFRELTKNELKLEEFKIKYRINN